MKPDLESINAALRHLVRAEAGRYVVQHDPLVHGSMARYPAQGMRAAYTQWFVQGVDFRHMIGAQTPWTA